MSGRTTVYLLRSSLGQAGASDLFMLRIACSSARDVIEHLLQWTTGDEGTGLPIVCIGPPEGNSGAPAAEAAPVLLDSVSRDVASVAAFQPRPIILVETMPAVRLPVPALQDWREARPSSWARYETAERFNHLLRRVAGAHEAWLLDTDRALARKGVMPDGSPVDPDFLEAELRNFLRDELAYRI
jgi:hypothetical protein